MRRARPVNGTTGRRGRDRGRETGRRPWSRHSKTVGTPGPGVILPAGTGIYQNCAAAPSSAPSCLTVGAVKYEYGVGEFEITVSQ